jgi:hypothetical protein
MSAPRDLDQLLRSFLNEGPVDLPDPSYDEVRDRMEHTRQRAFIGSWRTPDMNRYLKIGLAAAAAVVIAVVGLQFFVNSNVGGPTPSATAEPTSTPTPTPEPTPEGLLPEGGKYFISLQSYPIAISVTIPAPGWYGDASGGVLVKPNSDPPDGAGLITFVKDDGYYVYGDPCQWSSTRPDTPATTVDELVAALSAQASRDASAPVEITVGGYAGKSITLHVPDDAAFSQCDQGYFGSWAVDADPTPSRYHQGPGQIDELWVLDVNGHLVIIDASHYTGTPQDVVDELDAVVESATFEVP